MDSQMNTAVFIRLASPIQSWAGPAITGNVVKTKPLPTLTALRGLVAGACGFQRNAIPDWIDDVRFIVRNDCGGHFIDDFQTISPAADESGMRRKILKAEGKNDKASSSALNFTPDAQKKTSIVRRTYLADAEFLVAISHPDRMPDIDQALADPVFSPYLGRKAFAPSFPFYLGMGSIDALSAIPVLSRSTTQEKRTAVSVTSHTWNDTSTPTTPQRLTVPLSMNREDWMQDVGKQLHRRSGRN